jgi:coenzyme F420-reducing hydrogenase delta subunit
VISDLWAAGGTPPPVFSQVFILKIVKVLCFDTLLQVFILKALSHALAAFALTGLKTRQYRYATKTNLRCLMRLLRGKLLIVAGSAAKI